MHRLTVLAACAVLVLVAGCDGSSPTPGGASPTAWQLDSLPTVPRPAGLSADLDDGRVVGFLRNQTAVAALTLSGNKCVVAVTAVGPPALSGALGAGRNFASAQLPGVGFTVVACGETSMVVRLEGKVEMETAPGWHTSQPIRGNTYFSVTAPGTAPLSDEQLAASMT